MKVAVVLPRHNRFSPESATSIDLCAHDFVLHSRYRNTTTILCPLIKDPFDDVNVEMFQVRKESHIARAKRLVETLQDLKPDIVVVHQHLPTASVIAKKLNKKIPVLFHTHNFAKPPGGFLSRLKRENQYNRMAGIIFVSKACKTRFHQDWPFVGAKTHVVHNGLDFSEWKPALQREKTILYVGRLASEKGVMELVEALPTVLDEFKNWNAVFICSEGKSTDGYSTEVKLRLSALQDRVTLLEDQPHSVVKHWYENAAIAVVPSQFDEPFGRTAIEAFAGGAALITSGTGGLKEVVDDCAMVVQPCNPKTLTVALRELMQKEQLRKSLSEDGWRRGICHFEVIQSAATLDNLYDKVLQERQ